MTTTTIDLTSAILTLLAHDDAQTIGELHAQVRGPIANLRNVLRRLVADGVLATSRIGRSIAYVLVECGEEPGIDWASNLGAPLFLVGCHLASKVPAQRASSSTSGRQRRVIPATVDVMGALETTAAALEAGVPLATLSARPVTPVVAQPVEQRPFRGGRSLRDRVLNGAALLALLAPVLYALASMVRS